MTTPAVAALRAAQPDARIDFLTEPPSHEVFAHSPHVDEVLCHPRRASPGRHLALLRRLRRMRYDVVVDFFGNPRAAFLAWASGAPRRIGYDFPGRRWSYTERVPLEGLPPYAAAHKAALVERLVGRPAGLVPQVFPGEAERAYAARTLEDLGVGPGELLVALSPVSRQPYKVWPARHFARMADVLVERYAARVLLVWGPGERHFADAVRLEMHHQALPDIEPPPLAELGALLERAHLYVGNDNGPRHFAIAVGTPTVTVFGRPFPENWTPPGLPIHRTVAHDPGCKAACVYPRCGMECINEVPYRAVEAEVETLLEEILRDGRPH